MISSIGLLWSLLSCIISGVCSFSFIQPFWLIHKTSMNSLGLYNFCIRDSRVKDKYVPLCRVYGGSFHFSNLPSQSWQASCAMYGAGCALLCLCALLAIITQCCPRGVDKKLASITGALQAVAVIMLLTGLGIFPIGWRSRFVQHYCQSAWMYHSGQCQIGWAFILGIIGSALALFAPFLAQYTDISLSNRRHEHREIKPPDYDEVQRQEIQPAFL